MSQPLIGPVLMSYSRRDSDVMWRTAKYLREMGINVWVDHEKLVPGTAIWEEEIEKALKAASAIVVVMSPDSKNSEWVRREISLADQYRKHILPILVRSDEDSSITRQFVDLRQNEEKGLQALRSALGLYLETFQTLLAEQSIAIKTDQLVVENVSQSPVKTNKPDIQTSSGTSTQWGTILWATLGWAIAGAVAGYMYDEYSELVGGTAGGIIGGLVTLLALRSQTVFSNPKSILWPIAVWAIAGAIGWEVGWGILTEAIGAGFGMATFMLIGLVSTLGPQSLPITWKPIAIITIVWLITSALGWLISRRLLIDTLDVNYTNGWVFGTAIAWAVGGFVLSWQLLKAKN
jgi:TIR domain-containing protein